MRNTLLKSTEGQDLNLPQIATLTTLRTCTETEAFKTLVKIEQHITIADSIENRSIIQSQGKKLDILPEIIKIIKFFLTVTGKDLEEFQIQILAGDLYEKFKTDTIEDVILMFKMARMGDFGKIYRCDIIEVMEWAKKYLEEKAATREKLLRKKESVESSPGKYFHELPTELQERFQKIVGEKKEQEFLTPAITNALTDERRRRNLAKLIAKESNNKQIK